MPLITSNEFEIRRVILLRGEHPEILVDFDDAHHALPEVEIPRWQRAAEQLTAGLLATRGIDAVSLSSLGDSSSGLNSGQGCYEIMELYGPHVERGEGEKWVAVDCLCEGDFRDPHDFHAIQQARAQCTAYAQDTALGPFGALGWFTALEHWVQQAIRKHGLQLNGRFRQLNSCPTFSLIRFETNGPAVWFKAVGAPNLREYPVTVALGRLFPRFVPQLICTQPQSNGWLAFETRGSLLRESPTLASWEATAADLAEIQIQSLGQTVHILGAGGRDLRSRTLGAFLEPFFQTMNDLMDQQTKVPPAPLSRETLRCLYARVRIALAALEETTIPDTLGHLDLNPGNVICTRTGSVFLDWAEAFVGHPFFTFQYLLEHFRRTIGRDQSQEARIVARYCSAWSTLASENDIRRAFEVVPLVAVFVCAVGNNFWNDPRKLEERRTAGYLRSLTRRMEREARAGAERSLSCLS